MQLRTGLRVPIGLDYFRAGIELNLAPAAHSQSDYGLKAKSRNPDQAARRSCAAGRRCGANVVPARRRQCRGHLVFTQIHQATQPVAATRQTRPRGADRHPEDFGRFVVAHAFEGCVQYRIAVLSLQSAFFASEGLQLSSRGSEALRLDRHRVMSKLDQEP